MSDIKAANIMFDFEDNSVFEDYENAELEKPSPRKEAQGRTIYVSRQLRMPKEIGAPVLCDFGSAVSGDEERLEDVQPDIYRAPEVILEAPWTSSIDIWNTGCMVRWRAKPHHSLPCSFMPLHAPSCPSLSRG